MDDERSFVIFVGTCAWSGELCAGCAYQLTGREQIAETERKHERSCKRKDNKKVGMGRGGNSILRGNKVSFVGVAQDRG